MAGLYIYGPSPKVPDGVHDIVTEDTLRARSHFRGFILGLAGSAFGLMLIGLIIYCCRRSSSSSSSSSY
jgi:hypothetical protein